MMSMEDANNASACNMLKCIVKRMILELDAGRTPITGGYGEYLFLPVKFNEQKGQVHI